MNRMQKTAIGYVRVSTDEQQTQAQENSIYQYCASEGLRLVKTISEKVSSRKADRKIYDIIEQLEQGQILVCYELSRLARSGKELEQIVVDIRRKKAELHVLSGLGGQKLIVNNETNIITDMTLFMLRTVSEMERQFISERTKNALKAKQAQGVAIGRPKGKGKKVIEALEKLGMTEQELHDRKYKYEQSDSRIAKNLQVDRRTVSEYFAQSSLDKN